MATQTTVPEVNLPPVDPELAFQQERKRGIGGSDVFRLLNEPEYSKGCARELMYDKTGQPTDFAVNVPTGLFKRGHWFEQPIAEEYEQATGRKVRRQPVRTNPDHPWAIVHMDRQVLAGSGTGEFKVDKTGLLEIKSFHPWAFKKMVKAGEPRGATMLQIQHGMLVTGYEWAAFAGMNVLDCDLRHFDVPRDQEMIDIIRREGDKFWALKDKGELPARLENAEDIRCRTCSYRKTCRGQELDQAAVKALGSAQLVQIQNPSLAKSLEDLEFVKMEMKDLEATKEGIEQEVKAELSKGGFSAVEIDQAYRVYFKPGTTSRFQAKTFEKFCTERGFTLQFAADLLAGKDALAAETREEMIKELAHFVVEAQYEKFYERNIPTAPSLRVFSI